MNNQIRKAFSVIINNKKRDVWDIEGKELDCGNGEPLTWWIWMGDNLEEGVFPPVESDNWIHWHASVEKLLWDIRITQANTKEEKWNSIRFSSRTTVEMWCNKKLVYSFGTIGSASGLSFAMAKVQYLQVMLVEHMYNFLDSQSENGRKIYWYGLPATVHVKEQGWEIGIVPDYSCGLNKVEWWAELARRESNLWRGKSDEDFEREDFEESMQSDYINWGDALSDQHINWFRK
jgi:hypothetical protein